MAKVYPDPFTKICWLYSEVEVLHIQAFTSYLYLQIITYFPLHIGSRLIYYIFSILKILYSPTKCLLLKARFENFNLIVDISS